MTSRDQSVVDDPILRRIAFKAARTYRAFRVKTARADGRGVASFPVDLDECDSAAWEVLFRVELDVRAGRVFDNLWSYVHTAARHAGKERAESQARRQNHERSGLKSPEFARSKVDEQAPIDAEDALAVYLATVDETGRELLWLKYWEGLDFIEIGRRLGISRNAACKRHDSLIGRIRAAHGITPTRKRPGVVRQQRGWEAYTHEGGGKRSLGWFRTRGEAVRAAERGRDAG